MTGDASAVEPVATTPVRRRQTVLYAHASLTDLLHLGDPDGGDAVGEVERLGPATVEKIRDWLGRSDDVVIRPVLDLNRCPAVDGHDPSEEIREIVILRDGHCVFPWCTVDARATDLDHIDPYVPMDQGGPPGQTNPHNLACLCRRHHRCKTTRPLALPKTRRRHLRMARPPRPQLPRHPTRHPRDPHQLNRPHRQTARRLHHPDTPGAGACRHALR